MKFQKDSPGLTVVCPTCHGRRTVNQYIMNYIDHPVYLPCTCSTCAGAGAISIKSYRVQRARAQKAVNK